MELSPNPAKWVHTAIGRLIFRSLVVDTGKAKRRNTKSYTDDTEENIRIYTESIKIPLLKNYVGEEIPRIAWK